MKKPYISPEVEEIVVDATNIIAVSIGDNEISGGSVGGFF